MAHTPLGSLLSYLRRLHDRAAETTDGELLYRYADGDEAAFAALVRRHATMVWSVCRRWLDNEQDAEDAFQAAFLVLLRKAESLREPRSLGAFLHGVASRIAQKARVTAQRRRRHEEQAPMRTASDLIAGVELQELRVLLDEELERLPEKYRAPLVLCYLEGLSYTEAARQLGWRDGTVCGRLARAREMLRHRLSRRGLTLSGAALAAALSEHTAAPAATVAAVSRMAALFALGQTASGAVSPPVATLAQGALQAMSMAKVKTISMVVLALALFAAGAGLAAPHFLAFKPPANETAGRVSPDDPKSAKAERTDRYGDPLPSGALLRLGTMRFRSRDFVGQVAFSPDGKLIAAGSYGGRILFYDAATGRKLRQFQAFTNQFPAVAFAPDGRTMATATSGSLQIWDLTTDKELRRIDIQVSQNNNRYDGRTIVPLVFSHGGKWLASVAADGSIHIWEVKTGKEVTKLAGRQQLIRCLAFSPDDKTLFSASGDGVSGGSVRVWRAATGKEVRKISLERRHPPGQPEPLCFSPDCKTLAVGLYESLPPKKGGNVWRDAHPVAFIDLETGKEIGKLGPQPGRMKAASFSPDGKLLAAMNGAPTVVGNFRSDDNNQIHIWETETGNLLWDAPAHAEHLHQGPCHLAFSPDGKKLAASATASALHVWDVARGREDLQTTEGHHDQTHCVVFSPDGRTVASGSADHAILLWDAITGKQRSRLTGHQGTVSSLAFSPDGKLLASACRLSDQTVRLWDLSTGKELRQYWVPSVPLEGGGGLGVATWVVFTANGKILAAGGTDHKLRLWDVATGKERFNQEIRGLPSLPKGLDAFKSFTFDPVFSSDGRVLAFSIDKNIYICDVASGQTLFQFDKGGLVLALSPDGKTLLYLGAGCIRLMEVASGREVGSMNLPEGYAAAAFSSDGRMIAAGVGEAKATIHLFDVPTAKELLRLHGHQSHVPSLAFSPDGTKLASGQWDSTALIWDASAARRKLASKDLTPHDLERLWTELRDADAAKAHAALWTFVADPDKAVPFLKEHLHPVARVAADRLHQWIADLDADDFARREEASRSLAKLGSEAEPALKKALEEKPSLEKRRRLQAVLGGLACQTEMTPDALRQLRAIQVLEQIGTPEARQILKSLSQRAPAAPATRDAAAALARLARRRGRPAPLPAGLLPIGEAAPSAEVGHGTRLGT